MPRVPLKSGGIAGFGLSGKLKKFLKSMTCVAGIGRKPFRLVALEWSYCSPRISWCRTTSKSFKQWRTDCYYESRMIPFAL